MLRPRHIGLIGLLVLLLVAVFVVKSAFALLVLLFIWAAIDLLEVLSRRYIKRKKNQ